VEERVESGKGRDWGSERPGNWPKCSSKFRSRTGIELNIFCAPLPSLQLLSQVLKEGIERSEEEVTRGKRRQSRLGQSLSKAQGESVPGVFQSALTLAQYWLMELRGAEMYPR
jgi:hypothetical protein